MQKKFSPVSHQLSLKIAGTKGMCTATDYPVVGPGHSGTAAAAAAAEKLDTRQVPFQMVGLTHQASTAAQHRMPSRRAEDCAAVVPPRAPGADC